MGSGPAILPCLFGDQGIKPKASPATTWSTFVALGVAPNAPIGYIT
jgi:hypothetical protein